MVTIETNTSHCWRLHRHSAQAAHHAPCKTHNMWEFDRKDGNCFTSHNKYLFWQECVGEIQLKRVQVAVGWFATCIRRDAFQHFIWDRLWIPVALVTSCISHVTHFISDQTCVRWKEKNRWLQVSPRLYRSTQATNDYIKLIPNCDCKDGWVILKATPCDFVPQNMEPEND